MFRALWHFANFIGWTALCRVSNTAVTLVHRYVVAYVTHGAQDTILVDMMNGPENSKIVSYCVTDPDVSAASTAIYIHM